MLIHHGDTLHLTSPVGRKIYLKSVDRALQSGIEIDFNPEPEGSTSSSEGNNLTPFGSLSVLCVSSESHTLGDERVVKKN